MSADSPVWGADTRISMPVATGDVVQVAMGGFAMSQYRLIHDITAADAEQLQMPPYAPPGYPGLPEVRGDADLDDLTTAETGSA